MKAEYKEGLRLRTVQDQFGTFVNIFMELSLDLQAGLWVWSTETTWRVLLGPYTLHQQRNI